MKRKPLGTVRFVDGVERPVYVDDDGRQFVLDDEKSPVHGAWIYVDEPEMVSKDNAPITKRATH